MNLLGNLPLKCLDVLLALELHEGSLEFMGVNMDVIGVLLAFLEKRLHQVGRGPAGQSSAVALTLAVLHSCGHCFYMWTTLFIQGFISAHCYKETGFSGSSKILAIF